MQTNRHEKSQCRNINEESSNRTFPQPLNSNVLRQIKCQVHFSKIPKAKDAIKDDKQRNSTRT